jgi:hypothetical protein
MVITSTEKTEMPTEVVYIQNHIPVKLREDLMFNAVEVIWLQVHMPHLKPVIVGSCKYLVKIWGLVNDLPQKQCLGLIYSLLPILKMTAVLVAVHLLSLYSEPVEGH